MYPTVWVLWGFAALVATLGMAILGYAFGSFVLMQPHTSERALRAAMGALVRETLIAALTVPIHPFYYFVGRRFAGSAKGPVPVIFVHGYMQNRACFVALARALGKKGLGPLYGFNYPWFAPIASNAERLGRFVESVRKETGAEHVDLVCHSMGGLVAMEMMRSVNRDHVRRCVTIATPHAGIVWRGPLPGFGATALRRGSKLLVDFAGYMLPPGSTLSVYSSHDNLVHPKETSQLRARGGRDIEIDGVAHLAILFSPEVAEHVAGFLL